MNKEFIPYEQALALKELGFDEPCFGWYQDNTLRLDINANQSIKFHEHLGRFKGCIIAPLYQQAFRWFRKKYDVYHFVTREVGINTSDIFFVASYYKGKKGNSPKDTCVSSRTYEEAELECLKKLIEIAKTKTNEQAG